MFDWRLEGRPNPTNSTYRCLKMVNLFLQSWVSVRSNIVEKCPGHGFFQCISDFNYFLCIHDLIILATEECTLRPKRLVFFKI